MFGWLVNKHYENLRECSPYIIDGTVCAPENKGSPVPEGIEDNTYKGIVIFKNGKTLCNDLVNKGFLNQMNLAEPKDVSSSYKLAKFLRNRPDKDGAYILESATGNMMRASKIKNSDDVQYSRLVPKDFIFCSGVPEGIDFERFLRLELGNKTMLAMDLTQKFKNVEAFQIKRSAYGKLRMGKVTHFDCQGLIEEVFFDPYEDEDMIFEYYRNYRDAQGTPYKDSDDFLIPYSTKITPTNVRCNYSTKKIIIPTLENLTCQEYQKAAAK